MFNAVERPVAVIQVFRALPVLVLPGYSRPMVQVSDYLKLMELSTYRDDRVRPGLSLRAQR